MLKLVVNDEEALRNAIRTDDRIWAQVKALIETPRPEPPPYWMRAAQETWLDVHHLCSHPGVSTTRLPG